MSYKVIFLIGIGLLLTACSNSSSNAEPMLGYVEMLKNERVMHMQIGGTLDTTRFWERDIVLASTNGSKDKFIRKEMPDSIQLLNKKSDKEDQPNHNGIYDKNKKISNVRYGYYYDRTNKTTNLFALAKPAPANKVTALLDDLSKNKHRVGYSYNGSLIYYQTADTDMSTHEMVIYDFKFTPTSKDFYASMSERREADKKLIPMVELNSILGSKELSMTGEIKGNRFVGKVIKLRNTNDNNTFSINTSRVNGYFSGEDGKSLSGTFYGKTNQFEFFGSFAGWLSTGRLVCGDRC